MIKHYFWSAINKFGTQFISLLGHVLIARILSPADYGLIAMLSVFLSIANNITESGFADFLIRDPKSNKNDFSIIFVHNLIFSTFFYVVLFFCAPLISSFYDKPELTNITRILALTIIFKAISITEITRMRKELHFESLARIQLISSVVSVLFGYCSALNGLGYWALVVQFLSKGITVLSLILLINKWKPVFYFNYNRYKIIRKFGNNMLLSFFTNQLGSNLYSVIIGKFYNPTSLGYFYNAEKLKKTFFKGISGIVLTTSYSLLAKQIDFEKRKKMYVSLLNKFLFTHFTFSLFLLGGSYQLILIIFGSKWIPVVPFLQLLLISFLFQPLVNISSNLIKINNKPVLFRNLTILKNFLLIISLFFTYKHSIIIIIYGQIIARFINAYISMLIFSKEIHLKLRNLIRIIFNQILSPILSLCSAYLVINTITFQNQFLILFMYMFVFLAVFVLVNLTFKNTTFSYFKNLVFDIIYKYF